MTNNSSFSGIKIFNIQTSSTNDYVLFSDKGKDYLVTPTEYILYKETTLKGVLKRLPFYDGSMLKAVGNFDIQKAEKKWNELYGKYASCIPSTYEDSENICKMANFLEFYTHNQRANISLLRTLESSFVMIIDENYDYEQISGFVNNCIRKDFSKEQIEAIGLEALLNGKFQKYKFKISSL